MDDSAEDLAGAQGKFVVFLASLLQRAGVVSVAEFASLLTAFATTTSETSPEEGDVLAGWAAAVRALVPH